MMADLLAYTGPSAGVISAGVSTGPSAMGGSLVTAEGASAGAPEVISAGVTYVVAAQHSPAE